jgi:hypothetical protein
VFPGFRDPGYTLRAVNERTSDLEVEFRRV